MFYYDENKMDDILSLVNKNIMQMSNMENGYLDNMKPITRSGIYGNGIEMIDSQIVSIKDGLTDFKNITSNNRNALVELEKRLVLEVEDIPLPKDFNADDTGLLIDIDNASLSKKDGKKVNNNITSEVSLKDSYSSKKEKISKLKNQELEEEEFGDYLKTNIEVLKKLKKQELTDITIDDNYKIKMEKLSKLNYEELSDEELEDYLHTNKITLNDITKYIDLLDNGDKDED